MKLSEAIAAMEQGKKVRKPTWEFYKNIYFDEKNRLRDSDGWHLADWRIKECLFNSEETEIPWELFVEPDWAAIGEQYLQTKEGKEQLTNFWKAGRQMEEFEVK